VKRYATRFGEDEVRYRPTRTGVIADDFPRIGVVEAVPTRVVLEIDGVRRAFDVAAYGDLVCVDSPLGAVTLASLPRFTDPSTEVAPGSLVAPMPGTVVRVVATKGDHVAAGQPLLWLEAMKMEHQVVAPADGMLAELPVAVGTQVDPGTVLAVVRPPTP
jgi:propionyl-CoA carboxylase alpha chain